MADGLQIEFPDLPDLIDRMKDLDSKVQRSISRRATAKGGRVIRDKVRANAQRLDDPKTSRSIAKNVHLRWNGKLAKQQGGAAYQIGIRGGGRSRQTNEQNPGGDTYYWRFLEFGTVKMAARPFFRPALAQTKQAALSTTINEALRLIQIESSRTV